MIDTKLYTFLKLCDVLNYRKTSEELNMTQPAVTQHIQALEREYNCKLFDYKGRILTITEKGQDLRRYARSTIYNDLAFKNQISKNPVKKLRIGATKTIGDYTLKDKVMRLIPREDIQLHLIIDNTENLLHLLDTFSLDFLLIEGYFDQAKYGSKKFKEEQLVGLCSTLHPFANKTVSMEQLFDERLILREVGSGTRAVFENFLHEQNYTIDNFSRKSILSSFSLIETAVSQNYGISFVYESIIQSILQDSKLRYHAHAYTREDLATFQIKDKEIKHSFHYVFLKNTNVEASIKLLDE